MVEAGGGKPAVDFLVPERHWWRRKVSKKEKVEKTGGRTVTDTFAQLGLHAELQVLAAVFGVDHAVERRGRPALEPEGGQKESLIPPFVLQASLE